MMVAMGVGAIGGYGLSQRFGSQGAGANASSAGDAASTDEEQWYTCGMHPNVLQKGPGDCPICQMKLTPRKKESDEGGDAQGSRERKVLYWRAPMDPNFISQKPGKSPMGMDLVPVYADAEDSPSAHSIRIDPVTIQNMGIRTMVVKRGPLIKTIRTVGRVDYDEQLVTFIDTKFNGWIETLYADETGRHVEKGERLFDVYSPELYAAQEEYLAAVRNLPLLEKSTFAPARKEAVKLVEAAMTKLKYLDVSDEQIEALRATGKVAKTLTNHSPAGGIIKEKMALEGMYVKTGTRIYTIADLTQVWVRLDAYESDLMWLRYGQKVEFTTEAYPGRTFTGTITFIDPILTQASRTVKVRVN
ncbi:MAG: efflux RND transporter periplasmic adaptor subunit, partial [Planctomycetes bacterium]|nr:efflux RND transporter periplasmic adaptor subunit [Planctomycetota bacterium]